MKRKLFALLAIVGLLSVATAATASANRRSHSARADMELQFNLGFVPGGDGTALTDLTWVGTLDFGGHREYVITFMPTAPLQTFGDWVYFEENVVIYASADVVFTEGVLTTFDPGDVVFAAPDRGWGTPWNTAFAAGRIDQVFPDNDPYGLFTQRVDGNRMLWRGAYGATPAEFSGTFWVFGVR